MTGNTLEQRARFEDWLRGTTGFKKCKARGVPMSFRKNVLGDYGDYRVNDRWLAWEAALRLSAGEGWQSIETAPVDADWWLVWSDYYGRPIVVTNRSDDNTYWEGDWDFDVRASLWLSPAAPRHETGEGS